MRKNSAIDCASFPKNKEVHFCHQCVQNKFSGMLVNLFCYRLSGVKNSALNCVATSKKNFGHVLA